MNKAITKMSITALMQNKVRSVLTTLGVLIGTAIVIIVLSVGSGIEQLILNQISSITSEVLFTEVKFPSDRGTPTQQDQRTAEAITSGTQITTMTLKDSEDIRNLTNIKNTYALSFDQFRVTYQNKEKATFSYTTEASYIQMEDLPLERGRFFTEQEDKNLTQVVVLGSQIKQDLFGSSDPIGKNIKIDKKNFRVIGYAKSIGTQFFIDMDNVVYLPVRTVQKKLKGIDYVQAIASKMENPQLIDRTVSQIERIMRKNHDIRDPGKDDFIVRTPDEAMEIIGTVTIGISALLLAIASISLVVGGVGIMNTMYVAVSERTQEIGLKKALGATPQAIRNQFIFEALMTTLAGGIFGMISGVFVSWLVSFIAGILGFDWPFVIQPAGILLAVSISVIIGLIFGYAPAKKAARLNPIDALRS